MLTTPAGLTLDSSQIFVDLQDIYPTDMVQLKDSEVRRQIDKICRHKGIHTKPTLCRFLRYVVDESLAGHSDQIKGYTIGVDVLKKGEDFDPEQDSLVRIHAGRLRRFLEHYYLTEGKNDSIRIHIPKGSYSPQISSLDSEQTDNGETDVVSLDKDTASLSGPSLAIFNFQNLTGDESKDYFARGFSEELGVELAEYEGLTIFNFLGCSDSEKDKKTFLEKIKSRNVHFFIEGGVLLDQDEIEVVVRLTDAYSEEQIWARRYHRKLSSTNYYQIKSQIVTQIGKKIGGEYGMIHRRLYRKMKRKELPPLHSVEALLKFYQYEAKLSPETFHQALDSIIVALSKEPDSGQNTALLLAMHLSIYCLDYDGAEDSIAVVDDLADRAWELDQNNLMVKVICAAKHFFFNNKERFDVIIKECLVTTKKNPFRLGLSQFYNTISGNWESGKRQLDVIMENNTGFPKYLYGATIMYHYRKQDYQSALAEALKYDVASSFWAPMLRVASYGKLKRKTEAKPHIDHLKLLKPNFEEKAKYLISIFIKEDNLIEELLSGLRMAGMKL